MRRQAAPWIVLPFLLTWFVALSVIGVSFLPHRYQEAALVLVAMVWVGGVAFVGAPSGAPAEYHALRAWIWKYRKWFAVVGTGVVVGAVFSFDEWLRPRVPGQGWAGLAVQASLILWPFGVLLYQTRRFVVGGSIYALILGVVFALAAVVMPVYLIARVDANDTISGWRLAAYVFGPLLVGAALLTLVRAQQAVGVVPTRVRRAAAKPVPTGYRTSRARGGLAVAGILSAVVSSGLLLASAIRVPIERRLLETSQVAERGATVRPIPLAVPEKPTPAERRAIAESYSPVLRLHDEEPWIAYDASAALAAVGEVPSGDCARHLKEPCGAAAIEDKLSDLHDPDPHPPSTGRVFAAGVVYPRLVRISEEKLESLGDRVPKFAQTTRWVAQYWLFYPNNEWRAHSALGLFAQVHGGDWEWVGVGLDATAVPVFVAYSAHCAGTWRPWAEAPSVAVDGKRVLVGGSGDTPASHPLAIVALGSHANYATPGTREPDWASCPSHGAGWAQALHLITFLAAAREATPDLGSFQVPSVLEETETNSVAGRPLWWGAGGRTKLGAIRLLSDEHGPDSPIYHHAWKDPIDEIFGTDWSCDAGAKACKGPAH